MDRLGGSVAMGRESQEKVASWKCGGRKQVQVDGQNSKSLNLMFMGVERDCYYKWREFVLTLLGESFALDLCKQSSVKGPQGWARLALFFVWFCLQNLLGLLNPAIDLEKKIFPFRCFIWLIMFEITITYFLKAHSHICVCIPKLCIMVSVYCSCITGKC